MLFHHLADYLSIVFYQVFGGKKWKGFRVLAIDGTTLRLENDRNGLTAMEFGGQSDSRKPMARASALYDVLNRVFVDAVMERFNTSEDILAKRHLEKVKKGDLLLLDRGYPSRLLMCMIVAKGAHFLFRINTSWKMVREFRRMKCKRYLFSILLSKKQQEEHSGLPVEIQVRLVRKKLKSGEWAYFATSLLDEKEYKNNAISDLYWKRWQIEESYKFMKSRLRVENWSGLKPNCHRQDFGAAIVLANLAACLSKVVAPPEKPTRKPNRKQSPKVRKAVENMRQVVEVGKEILVALCNKNPDNYLIDRYLNHLRKLYEWIELGRSSPRKLRRHRQIISTSYG